MLCPCQFCFARHMGFSPVYVGGLCICGIVTSLYKSDGREVWGNTDIKVMKGTLQGGLSSPFLFNVFYQGMVNKLSEAVGGSCINGVKYNVFCYAVDILLCSTTVTGL